MSATPSSSANLSENPSTMTATGRWMALAAALLGWMFDGAEMGLFSMVGRSAIQDLMGFGAKPDAYQEGRIGFYFGVVIAVFLVGAATGGVLFGWLGDRIGRVRAMSLSVLTYALFTGLCGVVAAPWQIAVLRFIAALGMGGEWSLGVALVMEVWPNRSRGLMAGLIGAAANVGYLLVGVVGFGLNAVLGHLEQWLLSAGLPEATVASLVAFKGWRILMILGAAPALLTFLFRLFVPESEKWKHEQARGATSHWESRDLLGILVGALGPALIVVVWSVDWAKALSTESTHVIVLLRLMVSAIGLVIATCGYTYPVTRYLQRHAASTGRDADEWKPAVRRMLLAAVLAGIPLLGTWGAAQWAPAWAGKLTDQAGAREWTQIAAAAGACVGTIAAALLGDWLGRRITYAGLCVCSLASALWLYLGNRAYGDQFLASVFVVGVFTASFYGWLPLYLPELFGTKVRATGQGFGFNFGRILAAIGALQTGLLTAFGPQTIAGLTIPGGYPLACSTISLIYLAGPLVIWLAPETKGKPLPE